MILCEFKAYSTGSVIQPWNGGKKKIKKARNASDSGEKKKNTAVFFSLL